MLHRLMAGLMALDDAASRGLYWLEVAVLGGMFAALVVLGLTQIGLRNLADTSIAWADPAMRAMVLWIAMLAASLAARDLKHIRIDLLDKLVPAAAAAVIRRIVLFATAVVCLAMVAASVQMLAYEYQFQTNAFADVPTWVVQIIIPIGFGLMGWRFMRHAFMPGDAGAAPDAGGQDGT